MTPIEAAIWTEEALDASIRVFDAKIVEADADAVLDLKIERERMVGRRALVRADKLALFASATAFPSPTEDQAATIQSLTRRIDGMVASAVAVDDLLGNVTALLQAWTAVRDGGGRAGDG